MSTSYHPQLKGQTKVTNRTLETYLRCFMCDQLRQWLFWLPWAEYWYNTSHHTAAHTTPFEVVYGRKPPSLIKGIPGEVRVAAVQRELMERDEALKQLKEHLQRAQGRMKALADLKRQEKHFEVGEWVFSEAKAT